MNFEQAFLDSYLLDRHHPQMSMEEFQMTMIKLQEQGFIEMEEKDGVKYYRPTNLLVQIKSHRNSNPKNRN